MQNKIKIIDGWVTTDIKSDPVYSAATNVSTVSQIHTQDYGFQRAQYLAYISQHLGSSAFHLDLSDSV